MGTPSEFINISIPGFNEVNVYLKWLTYWN
jgi:hypothetical protein